MKEIWFPKFLNMINIILTPGIIPYKEYNNLLKDPSLHVFFFVRNHAYKKLRSANPELKDVTRLDDFMVKRDFENLSYVAEHYNLVYNTIIDDHLTWELEERGVFLNYPWQNIFSKTINLSCLVMNCIDAIGSIKPKFVFFHTTPHSILNWVFGRTAEILGIPVYYSRTAALPWRSVLVKGLKQAEIIPFTDGKCEQDLIQIFLENNTASYDKAIPSYEKRRFNQRHGNIWKWSTEFKQCVRENSLSRSFFRLVTLPYKRTAYNFYVNNSIKNLEGKYVAVFLHFQPERSSLPEGLYFSQQINLIRTLRLGLPNDVVIYVKEHPANYMNKFDIRYRSKAFYKSLCEISNTYLVDMNVDSFSIISNAIAIATITGVVGVQALIRGTSVLSFGNATYLGAPDCYCINDAIDVKNAYHSIIRTSKSDISHNTESYIKNSTSFSVSGIDEYDCEDPFKQLYRLRADSRVLLKLVDYYKGEITDV